MIYNPTAKKTTEPDVELGLVMESNGSIIVVQPQVSSACKSCGSNSVCFPSEGNSPKVEVNNLVNAEVGDRVRLKQAEAPKIVASLIVFGIPVITILGGTVLGMNSTGDSAGGAASGGIAGFALGMLLVSFLNRFMKSTSTTRPDAVEIVSKHNSEI